MKQYLSLTFLKDLIDFNLLNKDSLLKNNKLINSTLSVLNLNKEFKSFINIINYVNLKEYNIIFLLVEDPFLYQLMLKKILEVNNKIKIPIVVSTKYRNITNIPSKKKILIINISNDFSHKTKIKDLSVFIGDPSSMGYKNTGLYSISSSISTIKTLIFLVTLISNLLKYK